MSDARNQSASSSQRLDSVIESVMRLLRIGQPLDVEALAAEHPSLAGEIRQLVPVLMMAENLRSQSMQRAETTKSSLSAESDESIELSQSSNTNSSIPTIGYGDTGSGTGTGGGSGEVHEDLLYAAMALQCELITPEQFLSAFEYWHKNRDVSLKQLLFERHPLLRDTQNLLDEMLPPVSQANHPSTQDATYVFTPSGSDSTSSNSPSVNADHLSDTRFQILRALDRGGLGIVSVALDKELNREVAVKEIRSDRAHDRFLQQKFLLEAEVTGGLEHPGIVPIYGLGKSSTGNPYYAMRLIRGSNLLSHIHKFHQKVAGGEIPFDGQMLRKLLRRFIDICEAIDYAHSRGILHRDIKPVNVMLGRYGETLVVDWGLAKALGISATGDLGEAELSLVDTPSESPLVPSGSHDSETRDGSIVGTPAYAAPEQLLGDLDAISIRSDVYGLGATLYELLCGQPPAKGPLLELTLKVREGRIVAPRVANPQVPKALDAICRKAMALSPDDRYATASQLRAEVERWLDDAPVKAMPEPLWTRCRRWIRKHPTLASTLAAVCLMSILGISIFAAIVARNNATLAKLNHELDNTNTQLVQANEREKEARQSAQEQSEVALSTLNAIVNDIQIGLKALPGGSNARRRLADTVMPRLEKVVQSAVTQTTVNRSTLKSLIELSLVVLQMGADAAPTAKGTTSTAKLTSQSAQSAARLAKSTLERALAMAKQLMQESPDSIEAKRDYITCCFELGNISTRLGQQEAALSNFEEAVKTGELILATDPANATYQDELAMKRIHLGDSIVRSKRVEEAIKLYEPAIATLRNLASAAPNDHMKLRQLSVGLQFLGDAQEIQGKPLEAEKSFQEAVKLRRQVLQKDGRPQFLRELAYALAKLAANQQARSKIQESLETTSETIKLLEGVIALDPQDTWFRAELALNKELHSKLFKRMGNSTEALKILHEVVVIREGLSQRDPSDIFWKRNLSVAYDNLGKFLTDQGDLEEALEPLHKSLDISRELAASDPTHAGNQRDIGLSLTSIGKLCLKQSKPSDALPMFQESLAIFEKLADADPSNAVKRRDRLIGISYIADCYMAMDRVDEAQALYEKGLDLARTAVGEQPQATELKRDLGIWLSLVIEVHLRMNDPAAAVAPALEAVDLNRTFMEIDAKDLRAKSDYGQALCDAGSTLTQVKRFEEAEQRLKESIEVFGQLLQSDPENSTTKERKATAHQKLGDLFTARQLPSPAAEEFVRSQKLFDELVSAKPSNILWRKSWVESSLRLFDAYREQNRTDDANKTKQLLIAFLDEMISKDQDPAWSQAQRETLDK